MDIYERSGKERISGKPVERAFWKLTRKKCDRAGRYLVREASLDQWREIAKLALPLGHPAHTSAQVSDIQVAIHAFYSSQSHLKRGKISCRLEISGALDTPKFAPNGCNFAVMVEAAEQGGLFGDDHPRASAPEGQAASGCEDQACLVAFYEDGTSIPLIKRPHCSGALRDWAWSRDGQSLVCSDYDPSLGQLHVEIAPVHCGERRTHAADIAPYANCADDLTVSLSAHGQYIALYFSGAAWDSGPQIWIYSVEGTLCAELTAVVSGRPKGRESSMPVWHPNEPIIAFVSGRYVYTRDLTSTDGSKEVGWLDYWMRIQSGPLGP
ncbi:hypothetical protein WJX73_004967 [Symbiochloris irregularis]|uniref:Uncharacterized protein n=1 Tax=Symbiochloris irregularis TaxID=706552 RepID=A0AAW1PWF6_9CHLO